MTVIELIELRERMGLTEADMATGMGLGLQVYQDLETAGGTVPRSHQLAAERWTLAMAAAKPDPSLLTSALLDDVMQLAPLLVTLLEK